MVKYIPRKRTPMIIYTMERQEEKHVELNKVVYDDRKARFESRINGMVEYVTSEQKCRSKMLLSYFGQKGAGNCGQCDVCISKHYTREYSDESMLELIESYISDQKLTLDELLAKLPLENQRGQAIVNWAIDNGKIRSGTDGILSRCAGL